MPLKDKAEYNQYMKIYMRKRKQREQQELKEALGTYRFPINEEFPEKCILFRKVVLGFEPLEEHPFLKHNHLNKSTRRKCETCKPYCMCFEWYKQQRRPIKGVRLW